tara:strand:- start:669 stop:899 length:231 start_codon:yes stop_codon:yes gene_type:complete
MSKKRLILKLLELSQELDKTDKKIECSMIVNDMEILIDNHVQEQLNLYGVSKSFYSDDAIARLKTEYFEKGLKANK